MNPTHSDKVFGNNVNYRETHPHVAPMLCEDATPVTQKLHWQTHVLLFHIYKTREFSKVSMFRIKIVQRLRLHPKRRIDVFMFIVLMIGLASRSK